MESVAVGFWSIVPPILAITLTLITKEVISSLLVGILSGTLIYAIDVGGNRIVGTLDSTFYLLFGRMDIQVLINLALLGSLITVVTKAGGQRAGGEWLGKKITSRNAAMATTSGLGVLIIFNDFFSVFTIGSVMKPLTDKYKISRAKLAYILDATAGPVCILVPMGTWLAALVGCIPENTTYVNELAAFVSTIPYDLYAILAIILVFVYCIPHFDFGPMREAEQRALDGNVGAIDDNLKEDDISDKGTVWDMLIPIVFLIFEPTNPEMLPLALGATLSGSIFGDHCSPISDTTIVASASAGCNHIEHVSTQLPYALVAAGVSTVGFLVGGFSGSNVWLTLLVSFVLLIGAVYVMKRFADRRKAEAQAKAGEAAE